jgi:hypothetical protein
MNDKLKNIEELLDVFESHAVDLGHLGPDFSLIKMERARADLLAAIADLAPRWCPVLLTLEGDEGRWVEDGLYNPAYGFSTATIADRGKIIAWMPLPAPYDGKA